MTLLSKADYAAHRGVSSPCVIGYIKRGKIPQDCLEMVVCDDGQTREQIHMEKADAALAQNLAPRREPKAKKPAAKKKPHSQSKKTKEAIHAVEAADKLTEQPEEKFGGISLAEAQRQKTLYQAGLVRLQYLQKRGVLIDSKKVEKESAQAAEMVKASLASAAERIGTIYGGDRAFEMIKALQKEFEVICEELSR